MEKIRSFTKWAGKRVSIDGIFSRLAGLTLFAITALVLFNSRSQPSPYRFSPTEYNPVDRVVCVGQPIVIENVNFSVEVPDGQFVTVTWNTTFQKLHEDGTVGKIGLRQWGLHGSPRQNVWVYNQSFSETFPSITIQQPEGGLATGFWVYSGAGKYGDNQESGYKVKFWVRDCEL